MTPEDKKRLADAWNKNVASDDDRSEWAKGHEAGRNSAAGMLRNALDAMSRAQQEAASYKEDSAMLDWMVDKAAVVCDMSTENGEQQYFIHVFGAWCYDGLHKTPREAIRAAMSQDEDNE